MSDAASNTFIGPSITIRGHVQAEEDVTVAGTLIGRIDTQGGVTVAPGGTVEAEVSSGTVDVFGVVVGPVTAIDCVTIHPGGRVTGDVRSPRLVLADGGKLRGHADTQVQRQEVIDAVLDLLNQGPQNLAVAGQPKWGSPSAFGRG